MSKKQAEIKISVTLDEHHLPESIHWTAEDGGISDESSKAIMLSVWDDANQELLKIDLWTKDMPVDDMKRFFHQIYHSMAVTYQRATGEEELALFMEEFAEEFAKRAEIL